MGSSSHLTGPSEQASSERGRPIRTPLAKAWLALALIPLSFAVAFVAQTGVYAVTGEEPGVGTAPQWVDLTGAAVALVILLVPCIAGVVLGLRAIRSGVRVALVPIVLAVLLGIGAVVLVAVNL